MRLSPVTAPLLLVLLAGGANVLRDAIRYGYPVLFVALALAAPVLMLWPPRKTVHRDKHTSD